MNPIRAQRTWMNLSTKWINAAPYGYGQPRKRNSKRKIKKGLFLNLVPVEIVNAITGEVSKGYMQGVSIKRLRKWLEFHNYRAQVERTTLPDRSTFAHLSKEEITDFPVLIKLGTYQVPYLIDHISLSDKVGKKQTVTLNLKTVDNLKYLERVAERKEAVMKLFKKLKRTKKK